MNHNNIKIINKLKIHFKNNPKKLYSVKYFSKKWNITEPKIYNYLEKIRKEGFLFKFYFSANQSLFAWGIPKPIFAVYVLNPFLSEELVGFIPILFKRYKQFMKLT